MIPRLLALKSAVPPHALDQSDVFIRAAKLFHVYGHLATKQTDDVRTDASNRLSEGGLAASTIG
jgi:hypothetical protein